MRELRRRIEQVEDVLSLGDTVSAGQRAGVVHFVDDYWKGISYGLVEEADESRQGSGQPMPNCAPAVSGVTG